MTLAIGARAFTAPSEAEDGSPKPRTPKPARLSVECRLCSDRASQPAISMHIRIVKFRCP